MSKIYEITIKYLDGQVETSNITTDNLKWSIDQFIRNRKVVETLNIELKEKEQKNDDFISS